MQVLIVALVLALTLQAASADTIYVSNEQDNTISVIDGQSLSLVGTIPVGRRPRGIVLFRASDSSRSVIEGSWKTPCDLAFRLAVSIRRCIHCAPV